MAMSSRLWLIAASAFLFATPAAAELSAPEQKMIQTVDVEQDRTLSMLETWVNQNSGSLNLPGRSGIWSGRSSSRWASRWTGLT